MSQDKKPKSKVKIVLIILGVVGILALLYVAVGLTSQAARRQQAEQAIMEYHAASANYIEATLKVYYTYYGWYPFSMDELADNIAKNEDKFWEDPNPQQLKESVAALQNFEYSKRGDGQAYQITYTDIRGKQVVLEGNYRADFQ